MFHVGQKVECVNDGPSRYSLTSGSRVKKGAIYTILRIRIGGIGIEVVDLVEASPGRDCDGFDPERFRPIVERKTDISVFTKMLTGTPVAAH